jgi:hypothetical protein
MYLRQSAFKSIVLLFGLFILISLLLISAAVIIQQFHPEFFSSPVKRGVFAGVSVSCWAALF